MILQAISYYWRESFLCAPHGCAGGVPAQPFRCVTATLLGALNRHFDLLLSVPLMLEYEAVLTRVEQLSACGLTSKEVERILDDLASVARPVSFPFRWWPQLSDPNDGMVL